MYGIAEYAKGEVTVRAFETRTERDAETDAAAAALWRQLGNGPCELSAEDAMTLPPQLRGPHRPA